MNLPNLTKRAIFTAILCLCSFEARAQLPSGVWSTDKNWDQNEEHLYSSWIADLFAQPTDEGRRGWGNLGQVLRDPQRNRLWGSLGLDEDNPASASHVRARADCADVPYTLRAYFAWKRGLPFRYSRCTRGDGRVGPHCAEVRDNSSQAWDHIENKIDRFNAFIARELVATVHSGTLRTLPEVDDSDFYPLPLTRNAIRPGTVFVDVGSHVLVVTGWDEDGPTAVDGHPDGTVTLKRFSPDTFPYYRTLRTGGFKAFRPIAVHDGEIIPLPNAKLGQQHSAAQYGLRPSTQFYEIVDRLTSER